MYKKFSPEMTFLSVSRGAQSEEAKNQEIREKTTIAQSYFSQADIPENPDEPQIVPEDTAEPFIIPLDDIEQPEPLVVNPASLMNNFAVQNQSVLPTADPLASFVATLAQAGIAGNAENAGVIYLCLFSILFIVVFSVLLIYYIFF